MSSGKDYQQQPQTPVEKDSLAHCHGRWTGNTFSEGHVAEPINNLAYAPHLTQRFRFQASVPKENHPGYRHSHPDGQWSIVYQSRNWKQPHCLNPEGISGHSSRGVTRGCHNDDGEEYETPWNCLWNYLSVGRHWSQVACTLCTHFYK